MLSPSFKARMVRHFWKWAVAGFVLVWAWRYQPLWGEMLGHWMPGNFPLGVQAARILSTPMEERVEPDQLTAAMEHKDLFPAAFELWLWQTIGDGDLGPEDLPLLHVDKARYSTTMWLQAGIAGQQLLNAAIPNPGQDEGPAMAETASALSKSVDTYFQRYLAERIHQPDRGILYDYLALPYVLFSSGREAALQFLQAIEGSEVTGLQRIRIHNSMDALGKAWRWDRWTQRMVAWRVSRPDLTALEAAAYVVNQEIHQRLSQGQVFSAQLLIWPQWKAGLALMGHRQDPGVARTGQRIVEGLMDQIPGLIMPEGSGGDQREAVALQGSRGGAGWEGKVHRLRQVMLQGADDPRKQAVSQLASATVEGLSATIPPDRPARDRLNTGIMLWTIPLMFEQWLLLLACAGAAALLSDYWGRDPLGAGPMPGLRWVYCFAALAFWLWPLLFATGLLAHGWVALGQVIGLVTAPLLTGWVLRRTHTDQFPDWGLGAWALWTLPGMCLTSFWFGLILLWRLTVRYQDLMSHWQI